jgi:Succinylglutamate desuccinylase / Aspartoacylase family
MRIQRVGRAVLRPPPAILLAALDAIQLVPVVPEAISGSPHDYSFLIERWQSLAQIAGLKVQVYATAKNFDLYCFHCPVLQGNGGIYLSAGIHGDEAGATAGLYQWACLHASRLRELPGMIFPCLNPYGLVHNQRTDSNNRDLNRCYHLNQLPRILAQKEVIKGHFFRLAVCLHEDYDTERSITSETPSEYGMEVRIQANVAILQRAIELSLM